MLGFGLLIGLAFPFVVVLLGVPRDKAEMAERVRRAVAEAEITEAGQRIPITVSIGGSGRPDKNAANLMTARTDRCGRRGHVHREGIRTRPLRHRLTRRGSDSRRTRQRPQHQPRLRPTECVAQIPSDPNHGFSREFASKESRVSVADHGSGLLVLDHLKPQPAPSRPIAS
jgi:hypothetical protein